MNSRLTNVTGINWNLEKLGGLCKDEMMEGTGNGVTGSVTSRSEMHIC
jgi:hypothetical protein